VTVLGLERRSREVERMESEAVEPDDLARALSDLEWLAAFGLYHRPVLGWLDRVAGGRTDLSILDVASGGGDMLRRIARWGRRKGVVLRLEGVDIDPQATAAARRATEDWMPITWRTADAFAPRHGPPPDIVISSHFAHHLDDAMLVRFLRWMEETARLGWFVNDLHRHRLMLWGIRGITGTLRFHRFVVSDGPISVRRSFLRSDWETALDLACIPRQRVEIGWYIPFRWGVGTKPA
jgi:SAM-dependent methyltransferase